METNSINSLLDLAMEKHKLLVESKLLLNEIRAQFGPSSELLKKIDNLVDSLESNIKSDALQK
jgi:hypothetical protein